MDEYISKQAARKAITNRKTTVPSTASENEKFVYAVWNGALDNAWFEVDKLSAADVKPVVRGKWEEYDDWNDWNIYRCSNCGEEFILEAGNPQDNCYNFCPNCGADMRKDANDDSNL